MKTVSLTFFLIAGLIASAQPQFYPGEIWLLNGEKQAVFVELQEFAGPNSYATSVTIRREKWSTDQEVYAPDQLNGFSIAGREYPSIAVPLPDPYHVLEDTSRQQRFAEKLVEGKYAFYRLVQGKNHTSYYFQIEDGPVTPFVYVKSSAENLKTGPSTYTLPDQSLMSSFNVGNTSTIEGNIYLMEDSLYVLRPMYQAQVDELFIRENCTLNTNGDYPKLGYSALTGFAKKLKECSGEQIEEKLLAGKPIFQYSLMAIASPLPGPNRIWPGQYSYGGHFELKSLGFSQRISLGLHFRNYTEGQYSYLRQPVVDNVPSAQVDTMINTASGSGLGIQAGYHFMPRSNLRPFLYAGFSFLTLNVLEVDTQNRRTPRSETLDIYSLNGGAGIDFYFLRYQQLRLLVGYNSGFTCQLGYGLTFIR